MWDAVRRRRVCGSDWKARDVFEDFEFAMARVSAAISNWREAMKVGMSRRPVWWWGVVEEVAMERAVVRRTRLRVVEVRGGVGGGRLRVASGAGVDMVGVWVEWGFGWR